MSWLMCLFIFCENGTSSEKETCSTTKTCICNDEKGRQAEIATIKPTVTDNGYPERMIHFPNKRDESAQKEETRA